MYGTNIQSSDCLLRKIQVSDLYRGLVTPKPPHVALIRQLRIAYQINPKQYSILKRSLPFIVCGMFNPPYRLTENFGYTQYFIIDIDHLSDKGFSVSELKNRLKEDNRILLSFISPSEDGLKIMFRLSERCYDAGTYTLFYKEFLNRFSKQYELEQIIDPRTSDVTRACFVSVDPHAYYNELCEPVIISDYINTSDPVNMFELKSHQEKEDRNFKKDNIEPNVFSEPDKDIMEKIKQRLNPKQSASIIKQEAFVPQQLEEIMDDLKAYVEETGLVVTEIRSIQYGKKIRIKMGVKIAEVNLFYGRRGFSVVISPKCGTNSELNDVCAQLIQGFVDSI